jgi:hypothetical protein
MRGSDLGLFKRLSQPSPVETEEHQEKMQLFLSAIFEPSTFGTGDRSITHKISTFCGSMCYYLKHTLNKIYKH